MDKKRATPLTEQIEVIKTAGSEPIPAPLASHIEKFIEDLPLETMPIFDLTDPLEARKAAEHSAKLLDILQLKIKQATALKSALIANIDGNEEPN